MNNKRILLASPHMSDEGYEKEFINQAFETNWIAPLGANVDEFEQELAKYLNIKEAVCLNSGTAAMHMALKAIGIEKGDIVFCSSLTFIASVNPAIYENAIPVFIDSEYESYNMCPRALEKAFLKYPKCKAVIVVNLYGVPANMEEIIDICSKYNVPLIEDAAESLGAKYNGKQTGTFGEYGIFSFNGNKIITTSGGGMVVSNNQDKIQKIRFWATQSKDNEMYYHHSEIGYNYRLSNILAGIGRGQLKVLENRIAKKKEIYEKYKEELEKIEEIKMQPIPKNTESNYWLSVITVDKKLNIKPIEIIKYLNYNNIEARFVWKPMHLQPVFKDYDFITVKENEVSVSEDLFARGICLPSDTKMTEIDQKRVIENIKEYVKKIKE